MKKGISDFLDIYNKDAILEVLTREQLKACSGKELIITRMRAIGS